MTSPKWIQRFRRPTVKFLGNRTAGFYVLLALAAAFFPALAQLATGGSGDHLVSEAGDAGVYVLLALGLNVVVGYAGLLDLGYAAFFAIGSYTYAFFASNQLAFTPLHHAVHLPFWLLLFVGMVIAAGFGVALGFPTLRLRGDYLAIVTLGFGEIVPRVFRNLPVWTSGVNGIGGLDVPVLPVWVNGPWAGLDFGVVRNFQLLDPTSYYVLMIVLLVASIVAIHNLYNSRLGRAWVAIREDETAASAMGLNPVAIKLLAFAIGAAFSGFAGSYYGAKLSLVDPESFSFIVSVTVLIMVALGGMGNIPGVIVGSLLMSYLLFDLLPNLPETVVNVAGFLGLNSLNSAHGDWPGLIDEVQRIRYLVFGLILLGVMILRPEGLIPSSTRRMELTVGTADDAI